MKLKFISLPLFAALALSLPLSAAEKKPDHEHGPTHVDDHAHDKKKAGPNGGRLLKAIDPHAEFFVTPERKVQITFLDKTDKPVAAATQRVTVTGGERAAPTKLTFAKMGNVLISDVALPPGNDFPIVVQITTTPDAKMVTEKFNLNLLKCPECKNGEYACICDH